MRQASKKNVSRARLYGGYARRAVDVDSPALVIHLVRDLRSLLTEEQVAEEQSRTDEIRKSTEDDIKNFLKMFISFNDDLNEETIRNLKLESFDKQMVIFSRMVTAVFLRHLEFFTITFYISATEQVQNENANWNDFDPPPGTKGDNLIKGLFSTIRKNSNIYHQIIKVRIEQIDQDHKIYTNLEGLFHLPKNENIEQHIAGSMLGDHEVYFWTNFLQIDGNQSMILIRNREWSGARLGSLVYRLLTICTYRFFIMNAKQEARN